MAAAAAAAPRAPKLSPKDLVDIRVPFLSDDGKIVMPDFLEVAFTTDAKCRHFFQTYKDCFPSFVFEKGTRESSLIIRLDLAFGAGKTVNAALHSLRGIFTGPRVYDLMRKYR